jgi:hypothetical protein
MDHLRALRVLGLPPGSSADDIKGAWRDLAKVWHPDRFPHDERLRRKAGDNLGRINEAYEALRDYDPTRSPRIAARVRESVAIILGMGELGEPPGTSRRGPIGLRHSLRVLGLGTTRTSGETGTRHRSSARLYLLIVILAIVLAGAAVYFALL